MRAAFLTFFASIFPAVSASADSNTLFLVQENPVASSIGNSLILDQSQARSATVASDSGNSLEAAMQFGSQNTAKIGMSGLDGYVGLSQGSSLLPSFDNGATISVTGTEVTALLQQFGNRNTGTIDVSGTNTVGSLIQDGNDNLGLVDVGGQNVTATLTQTGSNNNFGLVVDGANSSVTYNIIGDNIAPLADNPVVRTNVSGVVVTMTVPGS